MASVSRTIPFRIASPLSLALLPLLTLGVSAGAEMDKKGIVNEWGETVAGQAISITSQKRAYAPEQRIVLKVCLKNVGQRDVLVLYNANPLSLYDVNVSFPDGKAVSETLYGQGRLYAPRLGTSFVPLKPGEEMCDEISLSRLFDFSLAGKYVVSVKRGVWQDDDAMLATSNVLKISIDDSLQPRRESEGYEATRDEDRPKPSEEHSAK